MRHTRYCTVAFIGRVALVGMGDIFILMSVDLERLTGIFLTSRLNCERLTVIL